MFLMRSSKETVFSSFILNHTFRMFSDTATFNFEIYTLIKTIKKNLSISTARILYNFRIFKGTNSKNSKRENCSIKVDEYKSTQVECELFL